MYIYIYVCIYQEVRYIYINPVKLNDKHTTIFYTYIGGYMGLKVHISFVDLVKKNGSVSLFLFGKHGLFESSATASMTVPMYGAWR